jgi:hypothetical protein
MRLHGQARSLLLKPSAAVTVMQFNEIHGPIVFIRPLVFLQAPHRHVDENHAPWPQNRLHTPVAQTDAPVTVMMTVFAVEDVSKA